MTVAAYPLKIAMWSRLSLSILILSGFSSFLRTGVWPLMSLCFPLPAQRGGPQDICISLLSKEISVCIKVAKDKISDALTSDQSLVNNDMPFNKSISDKNILSHLDLPSNTVPLSNTSSWSSNRAWSAAERLHRILHLKVLGSPLKPITALGAQVTSSFPYP